MKRTRSFISEERGAVLVQVGLSVLVLMAFNVFVLDYGMMWIGRSQAQNAADAGALAGAIARAYDDRRNPPDPGDLAGDIVRQVARTNLIWQQAGEPVVSFDCPPGVTGRCTRVDVYRDGSNGSTALPSFFGPILGINSQDVRATATAITGNGNAATCMSPIAFADDWDDQSDQNPPAGQEFSRYFETGPNQGELRPNPDVYQPPGGLYPGRVTVSGNFGERIVWTIDHAILEAITRERMVPFEIPGGRTWQQNMLACSTNPLVPGRTVRMITGLHPSEINDTIYDVYQLDPGADFDYGAMRIVNSCAPNCAAVSPRLLAVALFDPAKFQLGRATNNWTDPAVGCPTNVPCLTITNVIGFFIHRISTGGFGPHGHFLRYPGVTVANAPEFVDDGSWLVTTHLIR